MDNVIIIPGLWIKKSTINSDNKEIIRIIGEDEEKEGNWLTTDSNNSNIKERSSIPDYVIERDYVLLQRLEYSQKPSKKLNFGNIGSQPVVIEQKQTKHEEQLDPIKVEEHLQKLPEHISSIPEKTKIIYKERTLEEQIFDKLKKESTDEVEFHLVVKNVPNIIKLKKTANFLNLNLDTLSELLCEQIKNDVLDSLKNVIKKELNKKYDISKEIIPNVSENIEQTEDNENDEEDVHYVDEKTEEINNGIKEIDEFIKNL